MGITGRERTHILEFLFHKIYELMFPPYIRYLLWISSSFKEKLEKEFETSNIMKWKTLMKLEDEE